MLRQSGLRAALPFPPAVPVVGQCRVMEVTGSGLAFCPPTQRLSALASHEHGALPRPAALAEGPMSLCAPNWKPPGRRPALPTRRSPTVRRHWAPRRPLKPLGRSTSLSAEVVMPLRCLGANLPRCTRSTGARGQVLPFAPRSATFRVGVARARRVASSSGAG